MSDDDVMTLRAELAAITADRDRLLNTDIEKICATMLDVTVTTLRAEKTVLRDRIARLERELPDLRECEKLLREEWGTGWMVRCSGSNAHLPECGGCCGEYDEPAVDVLRRLDALRAEIEVQR